MADEEEGEGALLEKLLADAADMASVRPAAREEALRGLFARMALAGLSATAESTLLAAVKAATKIPMASLREDYKRIKGDSARAEKARRREEAAEGGEAGAGEDEQPTQRSVAATFVSSHDGLVVFNHSSGCWLAFNERAGVWRPDEVEAVLDRISAVAKAALEASEFSDAPATRASVESASFVAGAAKLARADGRMRKLAKEFDRAPHLLGTPGGIYDLRTGQRIEGDGREALVTKTTAVAPADKARCPRFIAFLDEACGGDPDLVEHVVRALGYVLWGGNPEEVIVFLFGPGGNGKSVLVALMRWLLHEYAQTASMATFQEAQGDRASHDVAMLAGARLVAATETKKGRTWDEQRVNALTGGDMITARHLYGQFFSFMPQFLPLLAGNHKPALATVNEAVRRRFLLWPFTVQPAVKDTKLGEKLQAEGPAILRLLINECGRWHAAWKRGETNRLRVPEAVTEATAEYLAGQEPVARWVRDRCEVNAKALGKPGILHADYTAWMTGRGDDADEAPLGLRAFRQALEDLGYGRKKINGEDFWGGLRLKEEK